MHADRGPNESQEKFAYHEAMRRGGGTTGLSLSLGFTATNSATKQCSLFNLATANHHQTLTTPFNTHIHRPLVVVVSHYLASKAVCPALQVVHHAPRIVAELEIPPHQTCCPQTPPMPSKNNKNDRNLIHSYYRYVVL